MAERLPLATKDPRANLIRAFKASGCAVCGVRYPQVDWSELTCDHIDPRDKPRGSVLKRGGTANRLSRANAEEILAELLLCQVLCTEHHLEKTRADGRNGSVSAGQLALFTGSGGWRYG